MSYFKTRTLTLTLTLGALVSTGARATGWKYAIEPKYDFAYDFSNGWGVVGFDHEFTRDEGYIDAKGNLMHGGLPYASAQTFKNGYAVAVKPGYPDTDLWSVIDATGKTVMRPKWQPSPDDKPGCRTAISYHLEGGFSYGLIPVTVTFSGECPYREGYADESGHIRFLRYFSVQPFHDGVAVVWPEYLGQYEGNRHLIDLQGNKISATFDRIEASSEGLSVACSSGLCGFLNNDGSYFKRLVYDDLHPFSEGRAAFKDGKLWGYLNRDGNVAIAPRFAKIDDFHEGLAAVETPEGKLGYIDAKGEWVFDVTFTTYHYDLEDFSEGYAVAKKKDGLSGFIDKTGNWVVPAVFGAARAFHQGLAAVSTGSSDYPNNGAWGYIRITE